MDGVMIKVFIRDSGYSFQVFDFEFQKKKNHLRTGLEVLNI